MMNISEEKTMRYFHANGFMIKKIPEGKKKTPDFEGEKILVEVKTIQPKKLEGLYKDSTYNAIKNNLQDAARKFRDYDNNNSKDHIVVIFSENIIANDIYSVWTGQFAPDLPDRVFASGMLISKNHKKHIDTVVWFRNYSDDKPKYIWNKNKSAKNYFTTILLG